jgi:hypothetical protein
VLVGEVAMHLFPASEPHDTPSWSGTLIVSAVDLAAGTVSVELQP